MVPNSLWSGLTPFTLTAAPEGLPRRPFGSTALGLRRHGWTFAMGFPFKRSIIQSRNDKARLVDAWPASGSQGNQSLQ